jgi:nicotinate-nucleotide pyrophosphorylase (carboxylating)
MNAKNLVLGRDTYAEIVEHALAEDIRSGDVTSGSVIKSDAQARALVATREPCVVSGLPVAAEVFRQVSSELDIDRLAADGDHVDAGAALLRVSGNARAILTAERTALNFMQRMCGIATQTASFVEKVQAYDVLILDTRKTTPTLRALEKYAVRCGGGHNHRFGLYDCILIKDNHRSFWKTEELGDMVHAAREMFPDIPIEVEIESLEEFRQVVSEEPDWVLLDNMSPAEMASCVQVPHGDTRLEASGGITLDSVEAVAASGVDAISLGCLTHTVRAIDLSLEFDA